jgi:glycosyltransferase involved in cell wall biosynthesis
VVQEVNGAYEDLFAAWPWTRHFRRYFEGLMRTQYRNADALITVTGDLASWLTVDTGREDVAVIPNGANTELFTPSAKPMRGLPEKYVVFFGAFAMWQGLDTLVAASEDQEWPADVALLLAGDGAARPLVEEAASRNPRIRYLGTISYEDMPGLVVGSIAGVSPQGHAGGRSEAGLSPLKVFETLSCGVPVVVTDFPGQAELVRDNNVGYVIPADDPKSLARAVKALVANPDKAHKMGMRGRGLIETSHSWDSRAGATAKILEGVIARRKAMS